MSVTTATKQTEDTKDGGTSNKQGTGGDKDRGKPDGNPKGP